MLIAVVNQSSVCTNEQAAIMTQAVAAQVRLHAAPAWNLRVDNVLFYPDVSQVPQSLWVYPMFLLDTSDQEGALGYHTEDEQGKIYGRVFCKTLLDHGAQVLGGPMSVASCLSHEALELSGDVYANGYSQGPNGLLWAQELSDYVEGDGYEISVKGTNVTVSNFILPEWFSDTAHKGAKFDWLGKLKQPFSMDDGGYGVYIEPGQSGQSTNGSMQAKLVHGPKCPEWYLGMKAHPSSRISRRGADVSKARAISDGNLRSMV